MFQGTCKRLRLWFHVMWWMMPQKTGTSIKNLQTTMGLGRYETAWTWLYKLRCAMICTGRDRLKGTVEVNETFIGGTEKNVKGYKTITKALVVIAVEVTRTRTLAKYDLG